MDRNFICNFCAHNYELLFTFLQRFTNEEPKTRFRTQTTWFQNSHIVSSDSTFPTLLFVVTGCTQWSATSSFCPLLPLRYTEIPSWKLGFQKLFIPSLPSPANNAAGTASNTWGDVLSLLPSPLGPYPAACTGRVIEPTTHLQVVGTFKTGREVERVEDKMPMQRKVGLQQNAAAAMDVTEW